MLQLVTFRRCWGQRAISFLALQNKLPTFDTRSEIYPSRTLVKNEIMKKFKSAQNIGNRARKCISCYVPVLDHRSNAIELHLYLLYKCIKIIIRHNNGYAWCSEKFQNIVFIHYDSYMLMLFYVWPSVVCLAFSRMFGHRQWRIYGGGGGSGGSGPPPLMGQHPISRNPTSPDLVHHRCKISYLKFLNKLILLL